MIIAYVANAGQGPMVFVGVHLEVGWLDRLAETKVTFDYGTRAARRADEVGV